MNAPSEQTGRSRVRNDLLIGGALLACLLPFVAKPFHIDDPVYVRVAQHVLESPADFYGFEINWHGEPESVATFNKNPPGVSFYLALAGALLGWSEIALHLAMLLPALALLLAVAALARRCRASPRTAALTLLTLPAFLVSATTLMADVLMLALWCGAVVLWSDGIATGARGRLLGGGALAGLCVLTKYNGIALIPLLAACGIFRRDRGWGWLPFLLVPIGIVAAFDGYMRAVYGESPFGNVGAYALSYRPETVGPIERGAVGLSFLGGGLLTGLLLTPLLWSRRTLAAGLLLVGALFAMVLRLDGLGSLVLRDEGGTHWPSVVQLVLFMACGIQWLVLAAVDLVNRRDASSWVLALWLGGIFVFATFLNWSTNARAVLPAAPAAALLVARRLEDRFGRGAADARPWLLAPLVPALGVALAVAQADASLAESARTAAFELFERHGRSGSPIWFRGAWGFQHYAESLGMKKIDEGGTLLLPGSIAILPTNNTNVGVLAPQAVSLIERAEFPAARHLAVMAQPLGAGFYSDLFGPLPFAFGPAPTEHYYVLKVERPLRIQPAP